MKKTAKEIKRGNKIKLAGKVLTVEETEISDIGKQLSQKQEKKSFLSGPRTILSR